MSQKPKNHRMTLRLQPHLDELLTEVAYSRRTSKAALIRSAIRQSLGIANARLGQIQSNFEAPAQ